MKSKMAIGCILTAISIIGLLYAAVEEVIGYDSKQLLFGIIILGVFCFFVGLTMLRSVVDGI